MCTRSEIQPPTADLSVTLCARGVPTYTADSMLPTAGCLRLAARYSCWLPAASCWLHHGIRLAVAWGYFTQEHTSCDRCGSLRLALITKMVGSTHERWRDIVPKRQHYFINAPRMAPATRPLNQPPRNHPQASASGIGIWMYVPKPADVPRASPMNAPKSRPAASDFGRTRSL